MTGPYGYFRLLNISTLGEVAVRNDAIFVQDAWTVLPNLTLNIGLRSEYEQVPNYGATGPDPAIEFGWGDKLAPRLGFAWDIVGNAKWKLYGSWGRYYDVTKYDDAAMGVRRRQVGRLLLHLRHGRPIPQRRLDLPDRQQHHLRATRVPGGHASSKWVDRRPNASPTRRSGICSGIPSIDPDLKPMESWEAQLGLDHQLTPDDPARRALCPQGSRANHRGRGHPWRFPVPADSTASSATPVRARTSSGNGYAYPTPVREYDALELTFDKRFSRQLVAARLLHPEPAVGQLLGSRQLRRAVLLRRSTRTRARPCEGTRTSAPMFDWPNIMYDANAEPVYGRLATDRTHQLRAQLLYSFPFGFQRRSSPSTSAAAPQVRGRWTSRLGQLRFSSPRGAATSARRRG